MAIQVTSASFQDGQPIPAEYTCDGDNVSPHLAWSGLPPRARSLALVVDDPDAPAGTWVHWLVFDLPGDTVELEEAQPDHLELPGGGSHGRNSFKNVGYGGPCPPRGAPHRYFFRLYALDASLGLPPGASRAEIDEAMRGHVIAEGQIMGTYQRR